MNRHPREVAAFMRTTSVGASSMEPKEIAEFENRYGERKVIRLTRSGLRVKNNSSTVALELNRRVSTLLANNIKARRVALGLTLDQVALKSGITGGKNRMWEIENCLAKNGLRFGTLYALAMALEISPQMLMPSLADVLQEAKVAEIKESIVRVKP